MAAITHRVATPSTANANSYASGSFTPAVDDLVCVLVSASGTQDAGSVTSTGLSFTKITAAAKATNADEVYLFVANSRITSATSRTVTYNCPTDAATGATIFVFTIAGMTTAGSSAVRQFAINENVPQATTMSVTLPAAALTTNPVVAFIGLARNPAGMTPPSGFTEPAGADTGYDTPTQGAEYAYVDSGFTGSTVTWGNQHLGQGGAIVAEFVADDPAAAGSGSGTTTWTGSATGSTTPVGEGSGTTAWSGQAAGDATPTGSATGTTTWSGQASGARTAAAATTGTITWTAAASGANTRAASGSGTTTWAGAASGATARSGTASGGTTWTGQGVGEKLPAGFAGGATVWASTGTGATDRAGTATGTTAWAGAASGYVLPLRDITVTGTLTRRHNGALTYTTRTGTLARRLTGTLEAT